MVQVVETEKRVLGDKHPGTQTSMVNLASTYRNQGRWKEAEELRVQGMKTGERLLKDEHPDTGWHEQPSIDIKELGLYKQSNLPNRGLLRVEDSGLRIPTSRETLTALYKSINTLFNYRIVE